MAVAGSDIPVWLEVLVAAMSLLIGSITGAVGSAWKSAERFQSLEQRLADKLDALRTRQDELHRENKADLQRLEDRLRRPR